MPCEIVKVDGATAIICGRRRGGKREPCFVRDCHRKGEVLCDWIIRRAAPDRKALTCDRLCCRHHARHVGTDKDLCLEHALKARKMGAIK